MAIVNLTPHPIVLHRPDGAVETIPSAGVARVATIPAAARPAVDGFPVVGPVQFGDVEGLPAPVAGTVYVVSAVVGARVARPDVFCPGTGPADGAIRNEKGHVVGITRLVATV